MMAMTYGEIIAEADERYPNGLTPESKLLKVYNREKQLMRTIYRRKTAATFDVQAGLFLYPLDFHYSKIFQAIYAGKYFEYEDINDKLGQPPFLYTYQNSIGIYPTPTEDIPGGLLLFHYMEPTKPTTATMKSTYPVFDPDFPMVLVYGLCKDMAEVNKEFDVANGFVQQYNAELEEFIEANREPAPTEMRVE
ncbi:phage adaptor protein [Cohnella xylanilytica]|uniref:phage adaptor protein n=1 Tax=Cohnella xylanilytica TaxID=557555 RepID=UPI001BB31F55|nr:hypothetical protein [Cohnella xylanilytica]